MIKKMQSIYNLVTKSWWSSKIGSILCSETLGVCLPMDTFARLTWRWPGQHWAEAVNAVRQSDRAAFWQDIKRKISRFLPSSGRQCVQRIGVWLNLPLWCSAQTPCSSVGRGTVNFSGHSSTKEGWALFICMYCPRCIGNPTTPLGLCPCQSSILTIVTLPLGVYLASIILKRFQLGSI